MLRKLVKGTVDLILSDSSWQDGITDLKGHVRFTTDPSIFLSDHCRRRYPISIFFMSGNIQYSYSLCQEIFNIHILYVKKYISIYSLCRKYPISIFFMAGNIQYPYFLCRKYPISIYSSRRKYPISKFFM